MSELRGHKITQLEASKMLGLSLRQVNAYCSGVSQHTGEPVNVTYATACLMGQLARGETPRPWTKPDAV